MRIVLTDELYNKLREHEVLTKWNMSMTVREALKEYFGKDQAKPNRAKQDDGKYKNL